MARLAPRSQCRAEKRLGFAGEPLSDDVHERAVVGTLVIDLMHNAAALDVPLEVNVAWGDTWATAKG